jgi:acyl-CoA hydrolase
MGLKGGAAAHHRRARPPRPAVRSNDARDAETRMVYAVFPTDTNHYDTLFGGQAMAWMDQAAFICATRWCRRTVVTAHSDAIDFHHAVPVGSIVELIARVIAIGRSSMTINVQMWVEPMRRVARTLACEGRFVFVALDRRGRPARVPALPG